MLAFIASIHDKLNKRNKFFTNYISLYWYYHNNSATL